MAYKNHAFSLHAHTDVLLNAIALHHSLGSRSEAVRFVLAAVEPTYLGTQQMTFKPSAPLTQLERRRSLLSNDDIRAMPLATREAFARWQASGELPPESAIEEALASGFPRERLEAALGVPL